MKEFRLKIDRCPLKYLDTRHLNVGKVSYNKYFVSMVDNFNVALGMHAW